MATAALERAANGAVRPIGRIEQVLAQGDLSLLSEAERTTYYLRVCESLGLNPLTKPFEYLLLDDRERGSKKLILYATKSCTDQLRGLHGVNVAITERKFEHGLYVVTARATMGDRQDEATGAVAVERENGEWKTSQNGKRYFAGNGTFGPLRGDALANAIMKAETKCKRRVTLSICGLGMLDETEVETIPGAVRPTGPDEDDGRGVVAHAPRKAEPARAETPFTLDDVRARWQGAKLADGPHLLRSLGWLEGELSRLVPGYPLGDLQTGLWEGMGWGEQFDVGSLDQSGLIAARGWVEGYLAKVKPVV